MKRLDVPTLLLLAVLTGALGRVLAQAPPPTPAPAPRPTWSHFLTATTPEPSNFSSMAVGYQLAYGGVFAVGAHVGPAFRHPDAKAFAPLLWGRVVGASIQGAGRLDNDLSLGGYLRVDRTRGGFSYQGFRQNPQRPDPNVTVAGPRQRAEFRQTLAEVGCVFRVDDGGRWVVQVETGVAFGKRGMFTPSDIYPGYGAGNFFGTGLRPYNEYADVWGLRSRGVVAYRIGRLS